MESVIQVGNLSHGTIPLVKSTLKTAWFMGHRIREAMRDTSNVVLGGEGTSGIVEADETYFGRTEGKGKGGHLSKKRKVFSLMERGGTVRSFHVERAFKKVLPVKKRASAPK